jgi:hypothetical protein
MRKLLGAAVIMLLAGCAQPTGDSAFLDRVKPGMRWTSDDAGLLQIGKDICKSERSADDERKLWADAGLTQDEAKLVVETAVKTLCPDRGPWLRG